MRLLIQESLAAHDLEELVDYLALQDISLASRFIDSVEQAYLNIRQNPTTGFLADFIDERLRNIRIMIVPDFPNHLIFFRESQESVRVMRVLHASRNVARMFGDD